MSILQKISRFFFSVYGFSVFLILMFLLLPFFMISFLLNPIKGGNILYKICRFWADVLFFCIGIRHTNIYEGKHETHKEYIFVSNHISYLDIPMMMKAIRGQHIRILGKAEIIHELVKGEKVISFKMKRRKGFRKKHGHRTQYTHIKVTDIA